MGLLKQFVVSDSYQDFKDYLESQITLLHKTMENSRSIDDIYRLQGQIHALRKLQSLREEILQRER